MPLRRRWIAKVTHYDGHRFASRAEAKRYWELKQMQKMGKIEGLLVHPPIPIKVPNPAGELVEVCKYIGDFAYASGAEWVIEDVKSPMSRTPVYRLKKKLVEIVTGMKITEINS